MVQLFCIETKGSIWIPHVSRQPTQSGCHYHSYHFAEAFFQGPARNRRRRRVLHDFSIILRGGDVVGLRQKKSAIPIDSATDKHTGDCCLVHPCFLAQLVH